MESLTGQSAESSIEKSGKTQIQNKVSIGKSEFEKLNTWLAQLEESSKGFLSLTKSDLINFLIRDHKAELGQKEMQQIRQYHYDPIRHLNWITPRLKEALASGDIARVNAIQEEIRGIELSVINKAQDIATIDAPEHTTESIKPRRKKSKKLDSEISPELTATDEIQTSPS